MEKYINQIIQVDKAPPDFLFAGISDAENFLDQVAWTKLRCIVNNYYFEWSRIKRRCFQYYCCLKHNRIYKNPVIAILTKEAEINFNTCKIDDQSPS